MKGRKNLNISDETYDRLKKLGEFGESFDDLLNKLAEFWEEKHKKGS